MTTLLALLLLSAVLSLIYFWMYIGKSRELRSLQMNVALINQRSAGINQLINEVFDYSKKNPNQDIERILESVGVTNKPAPAK